MQPASVFALFSLFRTPERRNGVKKEAGRLTRERSADLLLFQMVGPERAAAAPEDPGCYAWNTPWTRTM